jgi:hypothetical protein
MYDAISLNLARLTKRCQAPSTGPIDCESLQWACFSVEAPESTLDANFLLNRVDDFLKGERARGKCTFSISKTRRNKEGSLKRPEVYSYLESTSYHCAFGPQDLTLNSAQYEAFVAKRDEKGMLL